jgi:TetR/AcrR family transcriptional repressor of nem operon
MGHSRAEKQQSHERILDAAARMIRKTGPNGVSIADLMKAANLTHGGFYGHFRSRDALIHAAIERAIVDESNSFSALPAGGDPGSVTSIANRYLSNLHRDDIAGGCAIAALATDVGRMDDREARELIGDHAEARFERMAAAMGGGTEAQDAAVTAWCTMIGAMVLSRVFRGTKRGDRILQQAQQAVLNLAASVNRS